MSRLETRESRMARAWMCFAFLAFLAFLATVAAALVGWPAAALAADEHTHNDNTFEAWTDAGGLPSESGSYYLKADVVLQEPWEVSGAVSLCLNGHSVTYRGSAPSPVITVDEGNALNLYDCSGNDGRITGGTAGGIRVTGGTFSMHGGSITGNTGGPGLHLETEADDYGMVQLSGGSISANTNASGDGGGLSVSGFLLVYMREGFSITGNAARNGAGVYCGENGIVWSFGNAFRDNHASESGGGIFAEGGTVSFSNCAIESNEASQNGGGICAVSGSYAVVDDATIRNNTAQNGGGIYLDAAGGSMGNPTIQGGIVTGNQASRAGGGIYIESGMLEVSETLAIDKNTAGGDRNNVYLRDDTTISAYSSVSGDSRIGITMQAPGIFTQDFINNANATDPRGVFFSDKSGYDVNVTEDGKDALLKPGDFYTITIADSEHGSITVSKYSAAPGATVELTPAPDNGYVFESATVTGEDGEVEVDGSSFVMPACDVTVAGVFTQEALVHVESVSLGETSFDMREGREFQFTATVLPENANNKNVTWSTSDPSVATVSADGRATAVAEGTVTITVTTEDGGLTDSCKITVQPPLFTVTFTDGMGNTLSSQNVERGSAATAPTPAPTRDGYTFDRWDKDFSNITGPLTVNAIWKSNSAIDYIDAAGNPLYQNEYTIITDDMDTLPSGWYVVRGEVNVPNRINVGEDVNIILCDGATFNAPKGLEVLSGESLTIWCQEGKTGYLKAESQRLASAAIGGSNSNNSYVEQHKAGTITINGGVIDAYGGQRSAGIGATSTVNGNGLTLIVNAGTVNAHGGIEAAGIGSGYHSDGGTVTINGGTVNAYGGAGFNGGQGGDGIGVGAAGENLYNITITGGTVHAQGKDGGTGISSYSDAHEGAVVKISGGDVTAIGYGGAGIGTRRNDHTISTSGGGVQITGGTVEAVSYSYGGGAGHAIGKGYTNVSDYGGSGLELGDDRRVKAGSSEASAEYAAGDERVDKARGNAYAFIDTCEHASWSYDITSETHTRHCDYCLEAEDPQPHSFNDEGVCTACGARVHTISFNANGGTGSMASVKVVGGRSFALPACRFTAPNGKVFTGWDYVGGENKPVGATLTVNKDYELHAHWEDMTWARLQAFINGAAPGTTIKLYSDLTATSTDTALTIPEGSSITLDLNGYTLDRNLGSASSAVEGGSVLHIYKSNFTIKNGTITGGYAPNGGGVYVEEYTTQQYAFRLTDITVTGNRASGSGGGIFTAGYGFVTGGSISGNTAGESGGGIFATNGNWGTKINETSIINNQAGHLGGGIYAGRAVDLIDATVTNNTCGGQRKNYSINENHTSYDRSVILEGGGVLVNYSSSSLSVEGSTVITDNTCSYGGSSHASNMFVRDRGERYDMNHTDRVTISAVKLTADARIGVSYEIKEESTDAMTPFPVAITLRFNGNGSLSNFFADDPSYLLGLNSSGEVILGKQKHTIALKPGDGQGQQQDERVLHSAQYKAPGKPDGFTAPDGQVFTGWLDGSSAFYSEGQTIGSVTQNIVLTAQWGTPWQSLQSKIDHAASGATIKLDRNYTALLTDTDLYIPNGKKITIDLNGHTLDRFVAANNESVIKVGTNGGSGGTLIIKDTSEDASGMVKGGSTGVTVYGKSAFTLESGKIANNVHAGVNVYADGAFTMTGGAISGHPSGVVLAPGSSMSVSGSPVVTGNYKNVILPAGARINMPDRLYNDASIGISTVAALSKEDPELIITSGLGLSRYTLFTSDDQRYQIVKKSGEAALALPYASATVTSAQGLAYTGEPQTLATASNVSGGTVRYATNAEGPYSETLTGTDAGRYTYWYKVVGDDDHRDSALSERKTVTIAKATPVIGEVTADNVTGSLDPADAHLTRSNETIPGTLALDETTLEPGTHTYHWTFTPEDNANYKIIDGTIEITAQDREWNTPTYAWADDNSSVTATRVAKDDSSIVQTETAETTSEVTKEPTCATQGETTYTAAFTNSGFSTQTKTVANIPIDRDAHDWGDATYAWNAGNTAVTATRVCANDSSHVETETVAATSEVVKAATCSEKGETTYTSAAFENEAFAAQTKTETDIPIDPDAHKWGEWRETKPATEREEGEETRVCEHNGAHKETRPIPKIGHVHGLTHVAAKAATCTADGNIEYWVCDTGSYPCGRFFDKEQATADDEIEEEDTVIPATGHTPEDPVRENEVAATCEAKGSYDVVVYCSVCNGEVSRTTITTPMLPHSFGETSYEWSDDNSAATARHVCKACGKEEAETVETAHEVTKKPTATEKGETTYTAVFSTEGFETVSKTVADIDPLTYNTAEGDGQTWTKGSGATADFRFKRSFDDGLTFGLFTGIEVDSRPVAGVNYSAAPGSVVIKLAPSYLETLDAGAHVLTARFDDGSTDAAFSVIEKKDDGGSGDGGDGKPGDDSDGGDGKPGDDSDGGGSPGGDDSGDKGDGKPGDDSNGGSSPSDDPNNSSNPDGGSSNGSGNADSGRNPNGSGRGSGTGSGSSAGAMPNTSDTSPLLPLCGLIAIAACCVAIARKA